MKPIRKTSIFNAGITPAVFLVAVLFIIFGMLTACEDQPSVESEAVEKSKYVFDTIMNSQNIPGIQVAVWQGGEVSYQEAHLAIAAFFMDEGTGSSK